MWVSKVGANHTYNVLLRSLGRSQLAHDVSTAGDQCSFHAPRVPWGAKNKSTMRSLPDPLSLVKGLAPRLGIPQRVRVTTDCAASYMAEFFVTYLRKYSVLEATR